MPLRDRAGLVRGGIGRPVPASPLVGRQSGGSRHTSSRQRLAVPQLRERWRALPCPGEARWPLRRHARAADAGVGQKRLRPAPPESPV